MELFKPIKMKTLSKTDAIVAISKYEDLSITEAQKAFNGLLDSAIIIHNRNIKTETNKDKLTILYELKEKHRKEISRCLGRLEDIKKEKGFLQKQEDNIKLRIDEITNLFAIGFK